MYNKIILHSGLPGTLGTIELDKFGPNYFAPANANVAQNAVNGKRVSPGEYVLDSVAEVPENDNLLAAFGSHIVRFANVQTGAKIAIFAGDTGSADDLLPTEGSSVRVSNETLADLVAYLDGRSDTPLFVTTDHRDDIEWHGTRANRSQIRLIRPTRYAGRTIHAGFYDDFDDFGDDLTDWLLWNLIFNIEDSIYEISEFGFEESANDTWEGFGGGESGGAGASGDWNAEQPVDAQVDSYPAEGNPYPVDGSQPYDSSPVIAEPFPAEDTTPQSSFVNSNVANEPAITEPVFLTTDEPARGFDNVNPGFEAKPAEINESPVTSFQPDSYLPTNGY